MPDYGTALISLSLETPPAAVSFHRCFSRAFFLRDRFWTLQTVADLIRKEYGSELSSTTIWRYLRKLGFKPNLPREIGYGRKG